MAYTLYAEISLPVMCTVKHALFDSVHTKAMRGGVHVKDITVQKQTTKQHPIIARAVRQIHTRQLTQVCVTQNQSRDGGGGGDGSGVLQQQYNAGTTTSTMTMIIVITSRQPTAVNQSRLSINQGVN